MTTAKLPEFSEASKQKRKPQPHGKMDYSEAGRARNEILKQSKIWVDLDPSLPCMANGRRKTVKGIRGAVQENLEERIAYYFQNIQVNENGCWIWTRNNCFDGYGRIMLYADEWKVNRFAWFANFKQDPGDDKVCHECDVRLCSNPDHLFLGSVKDNMDNMRHKLRGFRSHDLYQILRVKELRKTGMIYKEIQVHTGIPHNHVGKICRGELWSYLTKEMIEEHGHVRLQPLNELERQAASAT